MLSRHLTRASARLPLVGLSFLFFSSEAFALKEVNPKTDNSTFYRALALGL